MSESAGLPFPNRYEKGSLNECFGGSAASVRPDLAKIHHFGGILKSLWQFIDFFCKNVPSLAKATCYWANFHRNKWPNIEKLISPSGHTEFSSQPLGTTKVDASRESKSMSLSINWTFSGTIPTSFCFFSFFSNTNFTEKLKNSNLDHWSRRQAR